MIIPNIWENKQCSKPPASCNLINQEIESAGERTSEIRWNTGWSSPLCTVSAARLSHLPCISHHCYIKGILLTLVPITQWVNHQVKQNQNCIMICYSLVISHSSWKWPLKSWIFPLNMVDLSIVMVNYQLVYPIKPHETTINHYEITMKNHHCPMVFLWFS